VIIESGNLSQTEVTRKYDYGKKDQGDAALLVLKVKEGVTSQGMWVASKTWKAILP
jgi:predicted RNA-binding protein with EMAP domain